MRELAFVSAALLRIPVLIGWIAVTAAMLFLSLNLQNAEAQPTGGTAGRDLIVTISKAGLVPDIPTSSNVTFVITAANVRSGAINNAVVVTASVPSGFTSLSASPDPASGFTCSLNGSTFSCTTTGLAGNSQKIFRISAKAPSTISGTSQNSTLTAAVDPQNTVSEDNNANNSDNFSVNVVTRADLNVDLACAACLTQVAPNLVYIVTARNTGDREAPNLLVRSTLPKDVAFVKVEENQLGTCLQNSTAPDGSLNVNCTLSSLPAGTNRHVRIIGKVLGSVPDGVKVTFAANVDPNKTVAERNENDNTAFMITTLRAISDVQVTASVVTRLGSQNFTGTLGCISGNIIEITLKVKNNGPYQSKATVATVEWPTGIVSSGSGCFDSCAVPAIPLGQIVNVTLKGLVSGNRSGSLSANCTVDPAQTLFDSIVANNKVTLTVCGN